MRGQIRKRGSSWCVVLYLGRRPQTGKKAYKWITYSNRREAEAALPRLLAQIGAGSALPSPRLTVGSFLDQYLTAILTGMRQGELLGLRWSDIDFMLGTASIQQTIYRLGGTILFKEPKTARGRRSVALPAPLIDALREHRQGQALMQRALGIEYENHGLVFCQPNGKPLHAHNIAQRDFRRVIERARLPRIRFHDLRHTHATQLLRAGVHPKVVQERLGHSTPAFTLAVYSHVLPGMQEEAAKILSARLLGRNEQGPSAENSTGIADSGKPSERRSENP